MLNRVQIYGLVLNLIIYIIMILPIIFISLRKSIYKSEKNFICGLIFSILTCAILSIIFYSFSKNIFSLFTTTTGIINYASYASKILFISSSLYAIKILVPAYFFKTNFLENKKTAILILSKIAVNFILILTGNAIFNTKGILYSFPICDFIYYIIYIKLFLNIIR